MDGVIGRDPARAAAGRHDLLVVGGGIQGVALAYEAARRGLDVVLLERGDFGGATSANSLRILHGGLRYLQSLDLPRFRASVAERGWFLRRFPDLVEPLPCLLPLHRPARGGRLRRRGALGAAMGLDRLLGRAFPDLRPLAATLPAGRLVDAAEVSRLAPAIDMDGLLGGALWHDALMPDSERLVVELLRWACRCGAQALNYVEAEALLPGAGGGELAVLARDRVTRGELRLRARRVVVCAGPWTGEVARRLGGELPAGALPPALAMNLLFDREPPSAAALGVAAPGSGAQTFFLVPWRGRLFAGTRHLPLAGAAAEGPPSPPTEAQVAELVDLLNAALPALRLRREEVSRVTWGWLPAARPGEAAPGDRPLVWDHGARGGPRGLWSVAGVKFTTARAVAEEALAAVFGGALPLRRDLPRPAAARPLAAADFLRRVEDDPYAAVSHLRRLVRTESVVHLDDLLLRRTDWGRDPALAAEIARRIADLLAGPSLAPLAPGDEATATMPPTPAVAAETPLHAAC